jgi:hypothetical protein
MGRFQACAAAAAAVQCLVLLLEVALPWDLG